MTTGTINTSRDSVVLTFLAKMRQSKWSLDHAFVLGKALIRPNVSPAQRRFRILPWPNSAH
jgi:hypothetical protein